VVNPMVMSNLVTLYPQGDLPEGVRADQAGTPYSKTANLFLSPLDVPCQQPPYGVLAAIDLESRQLLWERPIGSAKETGPLGIKSYLPLTIGTPQTGGTVTTAGGLIFISGTFDKTIRAVNLFDGRELWQNPLPVSSQATPMSYVSPQGKQTVVVTVPVYNSNQAAGFSVIAAEDEDPEGGYIIAYRLPD
jgi:quinate dehydrogenase (quinone)